jgi:hypothetical protein
MSLHIDKLALPLAVQRGVKLLDENITDWYKAIDTSSLDLNKHCNCVLGKLFRDYRTGLRHFETLLGKKQFNYYVDGPYHGFNIADVDCVNFSEVEEAFAILNTLWIQEIQKRKEIDNVDTR